MQWEYKDLLDNLELAVGLTYMTGSVNYKLNNTVMVKTGEPILQTGVYRSIEAFSSCKFLMQEKNTYTNIVGEWVTAPQVYAFKQDPDTYTRENYEYAQLIDTTWILVERATDANDADIILNNLKISQKSGEKATKTGYWKTPAQPDARPFIKQGELLPTQKNKD